MEVTSLTAASNEAAGLAAGKKLADAKPPGFLPDDELVRSDLLDYALEIEYFDAHLAKAIKLLEQRGELDKTVIIVTSDNGMAFPRAKANCYEHGVHVPLAIRWPKIKAPGRSVDDLVAFVDLAPTILAAGRVETPKEMVGRSLKPLLESEKQGQVDPSRDAAFSGRERHSSSRYMNLAYPQRVIRTHQYLLIRNFRPERWPAGAPQKLENGKLGPPHGGYHDIDACPTLTFLIEHRNDTEISRFFHLSVDKRPAEELFDIRKDPACLQNLADDPNHVEIKEQLRKRLDDVLRETKDPRILDGGDVFETYKRYSRIRKFPAPGSSP